MDTLVNQVTWDSEERGRWAPQWEVELVPLSFTPLLAAPGTSVTLFRLEEVNGSSAGGGIGCRAVRAGQVLCGPAQPTRWY